MRVTFSLDAEPNTVFSRDSVRVDSYIRFSWPGKSVMAKVLDCYSDEHTICVTVDVPSLDLP